ncbi:MAG: DUF4020 domain-containing protein [Actinomycetota bacterium]|nr:DUF4020 domain-containing protein [Actinomycetota bacterium]MDQ2955974.1 DUF4020 domain-containing protein [Actinomycetota bacterium]
MVWFGSLDVPGAVVEAHRAGKLVLFVGAGASMAPPSGLPSFWDLTSDIAAEASLMDPDLKLQLDVTLGRVAEECQVDVHGRIAAKVGKPGSEPNELHRAIAQLARTGSACRVVTTNYDRHLTTALKEAGLDCEEWAAPALPVGDDFAGLVYLHGRLGVPPERLVATDEDFGNAYLRQAWASRFLERMFNRYAVLFVGYSHNDVIMTYLGRSLPRDARRWILTPHPDSPLFRRLRISPIAYEVVNDSHAELDRGLDRWGRASAMGLLEHRQRLQDLVQVGPPVIPEDVSYIEAALADPVRVQIFTEFARGSDWLAWALTRPEARPLFDERAAEDVCSRYLAYWLASVFVAAEELSQVALEAVRDRSVRMNETLWWAVAQRLLTVERPRGPWLSPWILLLIRDAPASRSYGLLEALLRGCVLPEDRQVALALLEHLLRPTAGLSPSWWPRSGVGVEVAFRCEQHSIDEAWTQTVKPQVPELAEELLAIAECHLRSAHRILLATGVAGSVGDILSYGRSAIEPHAQDSMREPVDTLIDIARDSVESMTALAPATASALADRWMASGVPLLRRLAVHTWTERIDVPASDKLRWMLSNDLIWDFACRHEVYRQLAENLAIVDAPGADAVVAELVAGPTDERLEGDTREYAIFNGLSWVLQSVPNLGSALDAVTRIQQRHPKWGESEHPDLHSWISDVAGVSEPPISIEELHSLVQAEPQAALTRLSSLQQAEADNMVAASTEDAVSATTAAHPLDGSLIIIADPKDAHGFHRAVVHGWQRSTTGLPDAIAQVLLSTDLQALSNDVAYLLSSAAHRDEVWLASPHVHELARAIWAVLPNTGEHRSDISGSGIQSLLDKALNSAAGRIADYWTALFVYRWRTAGDAWEGLPDDLAADLAQTLQGYPHRLSPVFAAAIYLSRLDAYWRADRAWAVTHLLPLLDWDTNPTTVAMWDAFLRGSPWNDQMLSAGLLERYLTAAADLPASDAAQHALPQHLASIVLDSTLNLEERGWIRQLTIGTPEDRRAAWLDAVARRLRDRAADEVENQWNRWMRNYVVDRVATVPRPLTADEASAIAHCTVYLEASFSEAVDLIENTDASLSNNRRMLNDLTDKKARTYPGPTARFVAHLLRRTETLWDSRDLKRLVGIVKDSADTTVVDEIRAQSLRLGFTDAADW